MKPRILLQLNEQGDVIKEWSSAKEAAKALNVCQSCIYEYINGRNYTCKGYRFKYK